MNEFFNITLEILLTHTADIHSILTNNENYQNNPGFEFQPLKKEKSEEVKNILNNSNKLQDIMNDMELASNPINIIYRLYQKDRGLKVEKIKYDDSELNKFNELIIKECGGINLLSTPSGEINYNSSHDNKEIKI